MNYHFNVKIDGRIVAFDGKARVIAKSRLDAERILKKVLADPASPEYALEIKPHPDDPDQVNSREYLEEALPKQCPETKSK